MNKKENETEKSGNLFVLQFNQFMAARSLRLVSQALFFLLPYNNQFSPIVSHLFLPSLGHRNILVGRDISNPSPSMPPIHPKSALYRYFPIIDPNYATQSTASSNMSSLLFTYFPITSLINSTTIGNPREWFSLTHISRECDLYFAIVDLRAQRRPNLARELHTYVAMMVKDDKWIKDGFLLDWVPEFYSNQSVVDSQGRICHFCAEYMLLVVCSSEILQWWGFNQWLIQWRCGWQWGTRILHRKIRDFRVGMN